MTDIFDGMAGILNEVLGSAVMWMPAGGAATEIRAIFRENPVRIADEDGGEFLLDMPSLCVQKPQADSLSAGDTIAPGNGQTYLIGARRSMGSPAADAFVVFELELTS